MRALPVLPDSALPAARPGAAQQPRPARPAPAAAGLAATPAANCTFARGCGDAPPPALPAEVAALVRNHPCYSEDAHHHFARMHVAVAPGCNLQCNYCNRKYDCSNESRPGVVSERLSAEAAVRKVLAVAAEVPELSVVGIAGPGDALANPAATYATLEGIRRAAPDLTLCLSTNGLALPAHADRLADLGVRHVTVTVNAIDPTVGAEIYAWALDGGRRLRGRDAAALLSERQLEGIRRLVARGVLVKVNAVVIPGLNDAHLPAVVRAVRGAGAFLVNLVPLISAPEHGTAFGLAGRRGPTAAELERVQRACEVDARLMRHCRQCRADAVGRLAEDRFAEFTLARLPPAPARDAAELRTARRALVERARAIAARERDAALSRAAAVPAEVTARAAVATRSGGLVDEHFGHAREFLVYDVSRSGARLVGRRAVERYCVGGEGEDDVLAGSLRALADCHAVLVAKVGRCPEGQLAAAGIEPVRDQAHRPIEAALLDWLADRIARAARGEAAPVAPRPAADEPGADAAARVA
ncbi:nitrogenase cofactor biosynthesis protein NifB [Anaeromyxobacter oryzisoli]|uniref:nitrogenase cofactor biosynthesis protein NifB n=1 Tax=Anaeromyxobacter oryzisoli TaxID=2925408 RepID=UPI001F55AC3C|nr:nitrogenase cofactor biosynthesis protein NifB [Anaeromyxobacter sp. SG63]